MDQKSSEDTSAVEGQPTGKIMRPPPVAWGDSEPDAKLGTTTKDEREAIKKQLTAVKAQYKIPDVLMYKRSTQAAFVLEIEGPGTGRSRIADLPGQEKSETVAIARFVRAKLTGPSDMVRITLRGGDAGERQYAHFNNVSWVWDVEGLQVGQVDLNLQLLAEVAIDGKAEPIQISTFQKRISVQISFLDSATVWVSDLMAFWPFLAAAGSAGAGLLTFFGLKKAKPKPTASG